MHELSPSLLQDCPSLQILDVWENILSVLDTDTFRTLDLVELNMNSNNLTSLPSRIFKGLVKLELLQLSHNNLALLDSEMFTDLVSLYGLYLHGNRLTTLPPFSVVSE